MDHCLKNIFHSPPFHSNLFDINGNRKKIIFLYLGKLLLGQFCLSTDMLCVIRVNVFTTNKFRKPVWNIFFTTVDKDFWQLFYIVLSIQMSQNRHSLRSLTLAIAANFRRYSQKRNQSISNRRFVSGDLSLKFLLN